MRLNSIKLNDKHINESKKKKIKGGRVEFSLSPFDVPQQIEQSFDKETGEFVLKFVYIGGNEPRKDKPIGEEHHIVASIGKRSGRLYSITILPSDSYRRDGLELELKLVIESAAKQVEGLSILNKDFASRSYEAVSKALISNSEIMAHDAAAAAM